MSKGVNRLAQAIDAWTAKKMAVPPSIDLGTIGEDGSLKLDQFGPALPRSAYLIAEWMVDAVIPAASRVFRMASPVDASGGDMPETTYSPLSRIDFVGDGHQLPNLELRLSSSLRPGDRVLVLWVRDDPVVISKVVSADA
jgi:hypothetical protein